MNLRCYWGNFRPQGGEKKIGRKIQSQCQHHWKLKKLYCIVFHIIYKIWYEPQLMSSILPPSLLLLLLYMHYYIYIYHQPADNVIALYNAFKISSNREQDNKLSDGGEFYVLCIPRRNFNSLWTFTQQCLISTINTTVYGYILDWFS